MVLNLDYPLQRRECQKRKIVGYPLFAIGKIFTSEIYMSNCIDVLFVIFQNGALKDIPLSVIEQILLYSLTDGFFMFGVLSRVCRSWKSVVEKTSFYEKAYMGWLNCKYFLLLGASGRGNQSEDFCKKLRLKVKT